MRLSAGQLADGCSHSLHTDMAWLEEASGTCRVGWVPPGVQCPSTFMTGVDCCGRDNAESGRSQCQQGQQAKQVESINAMRMYGARQHPSRLGRVAEWSSQWEGRV